MHIFIYIYMLGAMLMWPIFKISDIILWSKIRQNLGGRYVIYIYIYVYIYINYLAVCINMNIF
jgi:hypothetical protein